MLHGLALLAVTALIMGGAVFIGWIYERITENKDR